MTPPKRRSYKTLSIRIDPAEFDYVDEKGYGKNWNAALRFIICMARDLEGEGLAELRGYFEPREWKYLADCLRNNPVPIWKKNELQRIVMSVKNMEAKSSYYGVNPAELCDKISNLGSIHVVAATARIHEFWLKSKAVTLDEWSRY